MASKSKAIHSAKIAPGQLKKMQTALATMMTQYQPVLDVWSQATVEQRRVFLENSPLLKSVIDWGDKWQL